MMHAHWDESDRSQTELPLRVFIGQGVRFQGVLVYGGTIRIDGDMDGEIRTDGCLVIGEGAVVTAKVTAGTLLCRGRVEGEVVVAARAVLQRPGILIGSIEAPSLIIEEGVRLKGDVKMSGTRTLSLLETPESDAYESASITTPEHEHA